MRAGDLNKRVVFHSLTREDDGGGGATENWSEFITVWGQFSPERGRESIQAGRLDAQAAGVLRIRSSSTTRQITATHRVTIDGTTYGIMATPINPDGRNVMLEMKVEEVG